MSTTIIPVPYWAIAELEAELVFWNVECAFEYLMSGKRSNNAYVGVLRQFQVNQGYESALTITGSVR